MLALFLLVAGLWLGGVGQENQETLPAGKSRQIASLLNANTAFLYQKGVAAVGAKVNSLFALPSGFPTELLRRSAAADGEGKAETPVKPAKGWKQRNPPPPSAEVAVPAPPPKAAPPPQAKTKPVEYLGCMTTLSGKLVALLRDPASGSTTFVEPEGKFEGLKVKAFTAKQITIQDAKGTDVTIAFGQQDKLLLE